MPARVRRTLGRMIEHGFTAFGRCSTCGKEKAVDLEALAALKGADYSLWNRRSRCQLTEGCRGWVHFHVGPGWPSPAYDERTQWRWFHIEWEERHPR